MSDEHGVQLVGRGRAQERCDAAVRALLEGRGGLVHVVADAGMGKSALLDHAARSAAAAGAAVAWGRPMAGRRSDTTYGSWVRALQRLAPPAGAAPADTPAAAAAPATLDDARALVLAAVGDRPTVLVLDDAHRADDGTRWLVEHLLDDLGAVPLLLLVATRPAGDPEVEEDLARWRSHRACTRVLLDPLDPAETAELLRQLTGDAIDTDHPLVLFAGGRPGDAVDLAEEWQGSAGRNRLISRIATLVEQHNGSRVLSTLAALQTPCTPAFQGNAKTTTISNMIRQPVEITLALLHSAQLAGLVDSRADGQQWALRHPMYADAALSDPVRTAAIRRQLAEALLVVEAEEGSGVASAECAGQFVLAGAPRPDVSWRAARWYLDTGQPAAARDLVRATVTTSLDEEDQIALNRLLGIAYAQLAMYSKADDYLNGMVNRARVRGLVEVFADAVCDLLVWLPAIPDAARLELIDEALETLPQLPPEVAARLQAVTAHALVHVDHDRAQALWLAAADSAGEGIAAHAPDVLSLPALHGSQARLDEVERAVHVLDGLDHRYGRGRAIAAVGRVSLALIRGTHDQITRSLRHLDGALRDWPSPELAGYGAVARLGLAWFDGDAGAVERLARSRAWLDVPARSHPGVLLGVGHLLWQQVLGPLQPLSEEAARACRVDAPRARQSMELSALGISAMANPDLEGELREQLDALVPRPADVPRDFRWTGDLAALAAFASAAGDVELANAAADLLEPHLEEMAVVLPTAVSGPVGLHVAHARLAAGDVDAAGAAVEAALRCCERTRARSWEALTRLVQARVALVARRPAEARSALEAARGLVAGGGMPRVAEELARLEAQAAGDARAVVDLSDRELEVLQLVSGGATNRQVARRLQISPKTVEYHLAGAFRSLGAGNRTEAVELARRAQLL